MVLQEKGVAPIGLSLDVPLAPPQESSPGRFQYPDAIRGLDRMDILSSTSNQHYMKRTTTLLSTLLLVFGGFATDHVISIVGLTYSPSILEVEIGDNVTIQTAPNHPTLQVSQETWEANGTTPLSGGFGPETSSFTFEITEPGDIYYVCTAHVQLGMKGVIGVLTTGIDELSNSISVNLSRLPITDGRLDYTIEAPEGFVQTIELYSISGSMIVNEPVNSSQGTLQLNARPGVYILLMKDRDGKALFREQVTVR